MKRPDGITHEGWKTEEQELYAEGPCDNVTAPGSWGPNPRAFASLGTVGIAAGADVFSWTPPTRYPFRIHLLRIHTSSKLTILSAAIGGGMNLLQPVEVRKDSLVVQDAADPARVHAVTMLSHEPHLELEPGDWVVGPVFQHPLLVKPNTIRVEIRRQDGASIPRVFARFLVPVDFQFAYEDKDGLGDDGRSSKERDAEAQRQFDLDAFKRILEHRGVPGWMLERCPVCDAYKVKAEPCLTCIAETTRG
jgi:hypothetical protein